MKLDKTDDELKEGEFGDAVKKIKYFLDRKLNDLKRTKVKNQTAYKKQLEDLKENMSALEGVDSINMFVNDAYERSLALKKRLANLLAKKRRKGLDKEEEV